MSSKPYDWERAQADADDCVQQWRSLVKQDDGVLRAIIRDALHFAVAKAVAEERDACAKWLDAAAGDWPDEPQIRSVLQSHAAAIRARTA